MSCVLRLELIGDDTTQLLKGASRMLDSIAPNLGHQIIGAAPSYVWVARITGPDGRYWFAREFLRGNKDYSEANSKGSRGVYMEYILSDGEVYEISERPTWRKTRRYFARVDGRALVKMTEAEVEEWLQGPRPASA